MPAYVGSNAKWRPIESLSSWRVLKRASPEFEKCGSGFGKVTHSVARFILIKPELRRNLRYGVALNQYASVHSLTHGCLTQIQTAAEPESLSLFLSVPEQHSGGCFLVEHREKPCEVKHSFTGRVLELKESRDETVVPSNALDVTSWHQR